MKFSIVIPTFNHCDDLLKPCIESIVKYTNLDEVEIIVVANGCTDNTREYIESLNIPINLIWSDQALGYTCSTNLGIKSATGDYVVLLNNDTEILPSYTSYWLNELQRPFINNPKMALTGSLQLYDHDINHNFIVFCCAMIKREMFDKLGLLDEIFNPGYGEDIDFAMKVIANGYQFECIDETELINGTNVGKFPLWHKSNKTFSEIPEYGNYYVHRNRHILMDRYNTPQPQTPKYSIVIPTYNHCDDLLKPCLESIAKYSDLSQIEIVIVANGCTDNTKEYLESSEIPVKLVWCDEALGYTISTNHGIKAATGEYVILMNNDVLLLEQPVNGWLDQLVQPFLTDTTTGITGPVKFSWDCDGVYREAMAFWLVMIKRDLFDKIGLLDEVFSPGMGEDGDFCIRAAENGYKLVSVPQDAVGDFNTGIVNHVFPVFHKGNGTFADNISLKEKVIDKNNSILNYRWGNQSKKPIEVSIVIPTAHNFHNALKPCLDALFAYTDMSDKEVIVVANGSTDETRQHLNSLSDKLNYIWSDEKTGVIRAYNTGIAKSRGKYIVLLDDDSILQYEAVDKWINILKKPFLEQDKVGATGPFAHDYVDMGMVLHSGCAMYDASLLKSLGGFDETFNPGYFSDPDVSMRIWRAGYKCIEVPVPDKNKIYENGMFYINFPVVHTGHVQTMDKNKDIEIVKKNREILYMRHSKTTINNNLQHMYDMISNMPCDINEHFPALRKYASECDHIIEFGTREVVSTYALMAGKPSKLLTYDLYPHYNIWQAASIAKENNIDFAFMERDTTKIEIEPTDLLFIDTLHTCEQLRTELRLHSGRVRKYIIMHDTETYGYIEEVTGAPGGLRPALEEFLSIDTNWQLKEHFTNNNGLTVLERVGELQQVTPSVKYSIVIPTYNHCDDLLAPCIESVKKYTDMSNVEVIVVANGCVDNTREYVNSLESNIKLIWSEEAIGYTKATNLGIKAAQGEYVVLLNNDTELLPQATNQWLDMLEAPMAAETDVGLTGPLQLYDNYANSDVLIFFCVMVRRSLFDKIGMLDEIFSPGGGEDIDFTVRANLAGYRSVVLTPTVYSAAAGTNSGGMPIWHKDNRTFRDIPEYSRHIVKRNGLINCKRYNKNIKLNLGAGGVDYPGYLSVDLHDPRAHVQMDITKLDFDDNSVTEILASHVFEHLNPYKSVEILQDWLRVLKPGGKLIMEMPNIEELCRRFLTAPTNERYGILNAVYGSVNTTDTGNPSDITSPHLFGWWPQSTYDHLMHAGFTDVVIMDEQIPHPESNFRVEAIKPMIYIIPPESTIVIDKESLKQQDASVYTEIFEQNQYAVEQSEIKNKIVIDVGANVGMFSLKCLELGAKHIYAIEAQPTIFETGLCNNVAPYNNITSLNYAVSESCGKTVFIQNNTVNSMIGTAGDEVETITLEKIVHDYNLHDADMVLKLDCEGSEFNILMTTTRDFIRKFNIVYAEFHGDKNINPEWCNVKELEQKMIDYGFERTNLVPWFVWHSPDHAEPMDVYVEKWVRI